MHDNPSDATTLLDDQPDEATGAAEDAPDAAEPERRARPRRWVPSSRRGKAAATLVVVLAVAAGFLVWRQATSLPEEAAFVIGDHVVTRDELSQRERSLRALYGVERPKQSAKLDTFRRDLAKSVAVSLILDQAAQQRGIAIADTQARDVLDRYISAQFGDEGRQAFIRSLGNVGTSEPAVLDEIKRQLAVGRLMDDVVGKVSVGEDSLRAAFEKRKAELATPGRRVVRNIVVSSRREALDVLRGLRAGAPFAKVAAQRSLDGSTRRSGGLLGELGRDQFERAVGDAVFAVGPGDFYGPVKGQFGWNVGRVDRIKPPAPARFADVKATLRETLLGEQTLRRWRDWLGERIRAADVEYAPEFQPADPDAPPAVPGSGTNDRGPR